MKIRADQLNSELKKGLAPIYIIAGDETLLVQEACDLIRKTTKDQQFISREIFHAEAGFDWNQIRDASQNMSLFSERKLLELRMPKGKPGDTGGKLLIEYAKHLNEDNILLVICNKLDAATQRSKWFKTIEKAGTFLPIWPVEIKQLPKWVQQRMQEAGLSASVSAAKIIADRVEGNLLAAAQEIEKLRLIHGEGKLDESDLLETIANNARYDVFTLVDAALTGNSSRALTITQGLKAEGNEPTVILWALSKEIRTLSKMAEKVSQGSSIPQVLQEYHVWEKRKPIIQACLSRHHYRTFQQMLVIAHQVDKVIKGAQVGDTWEGLTTLVLKLSQPRKARA